jgi:solute carrier family 25 protein 46
VIPILTSYEGALDCYATTLQQEGRAGLYKGFGALVLQFVAHVAVIRLTKFVLVEITHMLRSTRRPPPTSSSNPDLESVSPLRQGSSQPARGYSYTQQAYFPDDVE